MYLLTIRGGVLVIEDKLVNSLISYTSASFFSNLNKAL